MTLKKGGGRSALGKAQLRLKPIRRGMKGYMNSETLALLINKLGLPRSGRVKKTVINLKFPRANKFASLTSLGNRRGTSVSPGSIVLYNSATAKSRNTMAKMLARKQKHMSNSYRTSGPPMYSIPGGTFTANAPASVGILLPNKPPSFLQKALSRVKAAGHHVGNRLGSVFFRSAARSGKKKRDTDYLRRIHDIETQMRNIARRKASAGDNNKESLGDLLKRLDYAIKASKNQWNRGGTNNSQISQIKLLDKLVHYMRIITGRQMPNVTLGEMNSRIKATKELLKKQLSINQRRVFGDILRQNIAIRRKLQTMRPVGRLV